MKPALIAILAIIVIALAVFLFNKSSVPTDVEKANVSDALNNNSASQEINLADIPEVKNLQFNFVGYGPAGKFHNGTFKEYSVSDNKFIIKTASVNADAGDMSDQLNTHLCSNDFFNCAEYPEITFVPQKVSKISDSEYEVSGSLTFRDMTKQVSFKVTTDNGKNFSSDFLLDTSEFNFNPKFVTNEVRIKFSFEI